MEALPRRKAELFIPKLHLDALTQRRVMRFIELLDESNHVRVETIHNELFADTATPTDADKALISANKALTRLIAKVNESAERAGIAFTMCITTNKKFGAQRLVWFEAPVVAPEFFEPPDLEGTRKRGLVEGQRGTAFSSEIPFPPETPVIVLLTFNEHETQALHKEFCDTQPPETCIVRGTPYHLLGEFGGAQIVHRISAQRSGEAQAAAHEAYAAWHPRAIIGVGIAFGRDSSKQKIGDVLVSSHIIPYSQAKMKDACVAHTREHRGYFSAGSTGSSQSRV